MIRYTARNVVSGVVGLVLRCCDFRFSKDYRHGTSRFHRAVYAVCNTVAANYVADRTCGFWGAVTWGL